MFNNLLAASTQESGLAFLLAVVDLYVMSSARSSESNPRSVRIAEGGDLVIPSDFRLALGVEPGDMVVAEIVDGELHIRSPDRNLASIQAHVRALVHEGVSLVDQLIAERRAEAARE